MARVNLGRRAGRPMFLATVGVVVLGLAVAAVSSWLLGLVVFGALPGTWIPGSAANASKMTWLDPVKVALTIAAGIGAAVALVVAYRKQHLAERQELADAYVAAADQLGHTSPTVRLAGVYALANLADSWSEQRQQCVDVLCAHLRLPWNPEPDAEHPLATKTIEAVDATTKTLYVYPDERGEVEVRKTILRVVAEHLLPDDKRPGGMRSWTGLVINLTGAALPSLDWSRCIIPAGARFTMATFTSSAVFTEATFNGDAAFSGAEFQAGGRFGGATFGGTAWFVEAKFGGPATFTGATFGQAAEFDRAAFRTMAGFAGVKFCGVAGFSGVEFRHSVRFEDAAFGSSAWFERTKFGSSANFDRATVAGDARFTWAKFGRGATFDGVTFGGDARFGKATFEDDARFQEATFEEAASFVGVTFGGHVWFVDARFKSSASFSSVEFGVGAWFGGATCSMDAAKFDGATFAGPSGFEGAVGFEGALGVTSGS